MTSLSGVSAPVNQYIDGANRGGVTTLADASATLTVNQAGTYVFPQATANRTITLPTPAAAPGAYFRFISSSTANGANTWAWTSGAANMKGYHDGVAAGIVGVLFGAQTTITYSATAANTKAGDWVDFTSDGTTWWVRARTTGTADGFSTA